MLGTRSICVKCKDPQILNYPTRKSYTFIALNICLCETLHQECFSPPNKILFNISMASSNSSLSRKFSQVLYSSLFIHFPVVIFLPQTEEREGAMCGTDNAKYSSNHLIYLLDIHKDYTETLSD